MPAFDKKKCRDSMVKPNEIDWECCMRKEEHARLVMQWRNDPVTLSQSFHQDPKVWESFWPEYEEEYFTLPELPPLFALYEGVRCGFIRFRPMPHPTVKRKRCCEISINVAPDARGKGLGGAILTAVQDFVKDRGFEAIYAEIREDNAASHKVFKRAGFKEIGQVEKSVPDTGEKASIRQYVANLFDLHERTSVFVIAEAGSNWRMGTEARDIEMAKALIRVAADAGADAVKFQVFRPESIYVANAGTSDYLEEGGIKEDIYEIFQDLAMPYSMVPELSEYAHEQGIMFMASAFSKQDFEAIDPYVLVHKIASYEISHLRLLELAAKSGKPLIMSTGASVEEDIAWAVNTFYELGGEELSLLQCTAKYPSGPESMNLAVIPWLKSRFRTSVGLSDHSRDPVYAPLAAVALGATVVEKHFTLDNRLPGPDHYFAITPSELEEMVKAIRVCEKMLGSGVKEVLDSEEELRYYCRRSVQAIRDIEKGEAFKEGENIDILRPGKQEIGVHPKFITEIEGKTAQRPISVGKGVQEGDWQ